MIVARKRANAVFLSLLVAISVISAGIASSETATASPSHLMTDGEPVASQSDIEAPSSELKNHLRDTRDGDRTIAQQDHPSSSTESRFVETTKKVKLQSDPPTGILLSTGGIGIERSAATDDSNVSALVQNLRSISPGETREGTIDAADPSSFSYGDYEPVTFEGTAGERVTINMTSISCGDGAKTEGDCDSYISLEDPDGSEITENDNALSNHDSQITYTLESDGTYTIIAQSVGGDDADTPPFEYSLSLTTTQTDDLRSISPGETREGTIDAADPSSFSYGDYEPVTFEGTAGERVTINMTSISCGDSAKTDGECDTYLSLEDPDGSEIAENDNALSNHDSQITYTLDTNGTYTIIAQSIDGDEATEPPFEYSLSLTTTQTDDLRSISPGETKQGAIDTADLSSFSYGNYEPVTFEGTAGERVTINMTSISCGDSAKTRGDCDTYLSLEDPDGSEITENDNADALDNKNSQITYTLDTNGTYTIIAQSVDGDEATEPPFEYSLSLTTTQTDDLRSISPGETKQGAIDVSDFSSFSYGTYEPVTFEGTAGERVTINMTSISCGDSTTTRGDCDTFLSLEGPDGFSIDDNDDGLDNKNSQITYTLESDGTYTIIAQSDGSDEASEPPFKYDLTLTTSQVDDLRSISPGQTKQGAIDVTDFSSFSYGTYEPVTFEGTAGERVTINMTSISCGDGAKTRGDCDTFLSLEGPDGFSVADNDDGLDNHNSQITYTLESDGTYTIIAQSDGSDFASEPPFKYDLTLTSDTRGTQTPNMEVSIDSTSSPVTEGDTLTVTATVENTGSGEGTQTVSLSAGGTQRDSTEVSLAAGESTTVTLSWATSSGDAGDYTATVETADDSASTSVTVQTGTTGSGPTFAVTIDSTTSPVTVGEMLTVTATLENTGSTADTQTVSLSAGGAQRDSTEVSLAAGESTTVMLSWGTQSGDAGSYTATVDSADDSDSTSVTVSDATGIAGYEANITTTNSPVTEGETLTVTATVENTGSTTDTQTVSLSAGGAQRDSTEVSLAAGESTTITLSWGTQSGDAGDYTATVETADDSASTPVTVQTAAAPANFTVSIDSTTSPVTEGESLTVTATVENTGSGEGTQTVSLSAGGAQRDSTEVTLASGESTTVTLSWGTSSGDAGDYSATVETADDSASTPVTVQTGTTDEKPTFTVTTDSTNAPITAGETLTVKATVENTGSAADTQTISFAVGPYTDSTDVSLVSGVSTTVTFSWTTSSDDAGEYIATVDSATNSTSTSVSVERDAQSPSPVDLDVSAPTTTPDSTVTVEFNFTNRNETVLDGPALEVIQYPSAWTITSHADAGGTYSANGGAPTWFWLQVSGESSKQPTLTFDVPANTETGDYIVTGKVNTTDGAISKSVRVTVSEEITKSIEEEIAGSDGTIDIVEIQRAIRLWANNEPVPNTGGKTLGIAKLQQLVQQWASS